MFWGTWIALGVAAVFVVWTGVMLWFGWVLSDAYDDVHTDDC